MQMTAIYRRKGSLQNERPEPAVWCRHRELLDAIERASPLPWYEIMYLWIAAGCLLSFGFKGGVVIMNSIFGYQ